MVRGRVNSKLAGPWRWQAPKGLALGDLVQLNPPFLRRDLSNELATRAGWAVEELKLDLAEAWLRSGPFGSSLGSWEEVSAELWGEDCGDVGDWGRKEGSRRGPWPSDLLGPLPFASLP